MDSDTLKEIVQAIFDAVQASVAGRPLVLMAVTLAEMIVMSNWDKWFGAVKAQGLLGKPR